MYTDWENFLCVFYQGLYFGKTTALPWCRTDWVSISVIYVWWLLNPVDIPVSGVCHQSRGRPSYHGWCWWGYASGEWARPHRGARSGVVRVISEEETGARGAACAHRRGHASNPIMTTKTPCRASVTVTNSQQHPPVLGVRASADYSYFIYY